ncbi:heavy metal translocating P-type ATPase [Helicobacter cynogastricus]|uniref:heavy metal translocating P-type ATPase n=1 Tax=Helicobacter cynogastricus TaxID=329937 RepID=UPI000CF0F1F9|nr:heavy metal translocating P-type ATPase [Helicobacter cynogastricus]
MDKIPCAHCQLLYPPHALKKAPKQDLYFCCAGCESVYFLLHSLELENFYDKLGNKTLQPIQAQNPISTHYDTPQFLADFTTSTKEGLEVALILENIHCAACVWLIEHVLLKQEGINKVQVNYTTHRAYIDFEPQKIPLSKVLNTIEAIGYHARVFDPKIESGGKRAHYRHYVALVVGIFSTMNVMWIAIANYAGYFSGMDTSMSFKLNIASWILSSLTLFITGAAFLKGAFYGLKNGFFGMDLSVSLGALTTYIYSIYATFHAQEPYFESVSMIITLVFISKFLELKATLRANAMLDGLQGALPSQVLLLRGGERVLISPSEVQIGDRIEVLSGECVALDGELESAHAQVNSQIVNGEITPLDLHAGQSVLSGYSNVGASFIYRVNTPFKQSFLSQMVRLIQKSFTQKPQIQLQADKLAHRFTQGVLLITLASLLGWGFIGGVWERALVISVSVLIIACPCAFALATPIALVLASNRALKQGILCKQAASLETLAKVQRLFLDKTGTLTTPALQVQEYQTYGDFNPSWLLSLVLHNPHPISRGVSAWLQERYNVQSTPLESLSQEVGGLRGVVDGHVLLGGSVEYLRAQGVDVVGQSLESHFVYSVDGELKALFSLHAPLKPDSLQSVRALQEMGLEIEILSGDSSPHVQHIAQNLRVACHAPLNPEQKLEHIQRALARGEVVGMVGDGMNDAPALAQSQVSLCMYEGHDLSLLHSDVILLNTSFKSVRNTFKIAKQAHRRVRQNLLISALYNALLIPCAVCGLINPPLAALSMSLSSLLVVGNSFRLRG